MTGVEAMQAALAARTTPDRGRRYLPKTWQEVEAVIQQVRAKVSGEFVADGVGNTYQRGEGKAARRKQREQAQRHRPGRGWKACRHCQVSIGIASKRCSHCAGKQ